MVTGAIDKLTPETRAALRELRDSAPAWITPSMPEDADRWRAARQFYMMMYDALPFLLDEIERAREWAEYGRAGIAVAEAVLGYEENARATGYLPHTKAWAELRKAIKAYQELVVPIGDV